MQYNNIIDYKGVATVYDKYTYVYHMTDMYVLSVFVSVCVWGCS